MNNTKMEENKEIEAIVEEISDATMKYMETEKNGTDAFELVESLKHWQAKLIEIKDTALERQREEIRDEITKLDWIKLLDDAIKHRPTSWNDNPVREWRNASDEIWGSLMRAMKWDMVSQLQSKLKTPQDDE